MSRYCDSAVVYASLDDVKQLLKGGRFGSYNTEEPTFIPRGDLLRVLDGAMLALSINEAEFLIVLACEQDEAEAE